MNKKLFYFSIVGFFFTSAAGILLHFAYDYSHHNPLVGMFVPISESTWEHMKLVFFPSFLYCMIGWPFFCRSCPLYFRSYMTGIFTGTLSVAIIFYTYTGILGNHYLFLDILTFLISAAAVFLIAWQTEVQNCRLLPLPLIVTLVVALMVGFFIFTYSPPEVALFSVPSGNSL